jgi:hypothetical protein
MPVFPWNQNTTSKVSQQIITTTGTSATDFIHYNPGSVTVYPPPKKKRKSRKRELKDIPLSKNDLKWLEKIIRGNDATDLPKTTYKKLIAHKMIEVKLTERGRKEGFIEALAYKK